MEDYETRGLIDEFENLKPRKLVDPCNIDTHSRKYWQNVFQAMDDYSAVPHHKREHVLKATLDDSRLISRIRNIFDVYKHDDIIDFDKLLGGETIIVDKARIAKEQRFLFIDYDEKDYTPLPHLQLKCESSKKLRHSLYPSPPNVKLDRKSTIDYRKELTKIKDETAEKGDTMYAAFLKKSPEMASRWRPKPPLTLDGMTLAAKCDTITREIATNFVEWMDSLGGENKTDLDVKSIERLFEIGFACHAADSLKVNMKELNAVTECVAQARQLPELSYSTQLYRQLYRDKSAVKNREANFAFGTMLPPEMRRGTSEDSDVAKWLENKRVPEKLATMAVVWENIESLKSTEGYCNWLLEHEDIIPPSYLVNKGLLERNSDAQLVPINSNTQAPSKASVASSVNNEYV